MGKTYVTVCTWCVGIIVCVCVSVRVRVCVGGERVCDDHHAEDQCRNGAVMQRESSVCVPIHTCRQTSR